MPSEHKFLNESQVRDVLDAQASGLAPGKGLENVVMENTNGSFRYRFATAEEVKAGTDAFDADVKAAAERKARTDKLYAAHVASVAASEAAVGAAVTKP